MISENAEGKCCWLYSWFQLNSATAAVTALQLHLDQRECCREMLLAAQLASTAAACNAN